MKNKKFVCFCHDITEADIIQAIELGYDDLETLKRFTGLSTGPCEGKTCLMHAIRILTRMGKMDQMKTTVMRPPVDPVPIGVLAAGAENES